MSVRRTPLPLAVTFPLSGRFRDLHPLEYVRAGRTNKEAASPPGRRLFFVPPPYSPPHFRSSSTQTTPSSATSVAKMGNNVAHECSTTPLRDEKRRKRFPRVRNTLLRSKRGRKRIPIDQGEMLLLSVSPQSQKNIQNRSQLLHHLPSHRRL